MTLTNNSYRPGAQFWRDRGLGKTIYLTFSRLSSSAVRLPFSRFSSNSSITAWSTIFSPECFDSNILHSLCNKKIEIISKSSIFVQKSRFCLRRNWARVIRKVQKSHFLNQFQSQTVEIKNSYSKLEVMNHCYLLIDLI